MKERKTKGTNDIFLNLHDEPTVFCPNNERKLI